MIAKVNRGSRVGGLLRYLFGPGDANEHTNPHLVASFDGSPSRLEPPLRANGKHDLRRVTNLLEEPLYLARARDWDVARPVWHLSLRAAPDDPELGDKQWAELAKGVVAASGLGPELGPDGQEVAGGRPGCRWVAVRHGPDHIHVVVTLAREDGSSPGLYRDYFKVGAFCRKTEDELGLHKTGRRDRAGEVVATRQETNKVKRLELPVAPRIAARTIVQTAVAAAASEQEFFTRLLITPGIVLRKRYSTVNPGEVTGYSVGVPGDTDAQGQQITFGGGKLAPDLSLPKLRARWAVPQDSLPPPAPSVSWTPPASSEERARVLAEATAATKAAAQEITLLAATNPYAPTPLGYGAADFARAAAVVLEGRDNSGPLTQAAEDLSRASREAWSRIPAPTHASRALRDAGRSLLLLRRLPKGRGREAAALLAQLGALAEAITQLREAQDRLAHAQAAQRAATGLVATTRLKQMAAVGARTTAGTPETTTLGTTTPGTGSVRSPVRSPAKPSGRPRRPKPPDPWRPPLGPMPGPPPRRGR